MFYYFSIGQTDAMCSSEVLANIYQARRCSFSEESNLRSHGRQKLKHHTILIFTAFFRADYTRISQRGDASR
jgi:hypothetical protein